MSKTLSKKVGNLIKSDTISSIEVNLSVSTSKHLNQRESNSEILVIYCTPALALANITMGTIITS